MASDSPERRVAEHYTHGDLERAILEALAATGVDLDHLTPQDLASVDELHTGGREATVAFADQLDLRPGMHLLDVGSGLGGPARHFAQERGCRVTGIELTEEFVRVAEALTRRLGLADRVSYRCGSALALPFAAASFDGAYMIHVGMNIADKAALFGEVRRVLRPGGVFAIYDVMGDGGALRFPLPWASEPGFSFVESAAAYRRLLEDAGFEVRAERDRRDAAIAFFQRLRGMAQRGGPPPLGPQIVMGATTSQKLANLAEGVERGLIAPTEIVCRAA
jgi:SAM-dependent methyltransferase